MNAHVFLVPRGRAPGRWREAFDDIRVVDSVAEAIRRVRAGSIVWVDVGQAQWMRDLHSARPDLVLVAMSMNPTAAEGMAAFEAGARGYCHALAVPEMLRQVAVVVSNGGLWVGVELMARAVATVSRIGAIDGQGSSLLDELTPRERAVALQVASGASNKEVAQRLDVTPRTVKAHMGAIFDKLGVRDRLQLVLMLRQAGAASRPTG